MGIDPMPPETIRLRQRLRELRHHLDAAETLYQQVGRGEECRELMEEARELVDEVWGAK